MSLVDCRLPWVPIGLALRAQNISGEEGFILEESVGCGEVSHEVFIDRESWESLKEFVSNVQPFD